MDNKPTNISFALLKITTEQFAVVEGSYNETTNIRLATNFRFSSDNVQRMIIVYSNFTFEADGKPFIIIEAGCHFQIKEDGWFQMMNTDTNVLTVPKNVMNHLAMLTIGTTRGILHNKTENTNFNNFIIPTINVTEIIKNEVSFDFNAVLKKE